METKLNIVTDRKKEAIEKLGLSKSDPIRYGRKKNKLNVYFWDGITTLEVKELGRKAANELKKNKVDALLLNISKYGGLMDYVEKEINIDNAETDGYNLLEAFLLAVQLGNYDVKELIKDPYYKGDIIELGIVATDEIKDDVYKLLDDLDILTGGITWLKNIVNRPTNLLTYEDLIRTIATRITILNKSLKNIGHPTIELNTYSADNIKMPLTKAVCSASDTPPVLMHLHYEPVNIKDDEELYHIVLVGKGVHYDAGGINLKPAESMSYMHYDKAGAITAITLIMLAAMSNMNIKLDVVVGFAENLVSEKSYKPGDVLTAANGKTVEITHTDAEGRLVLADCLCYVNNNIKDYDNLFTIATLTGAAKRALGNETAAIIGDDTDILDVMEEIGGETGDYCCRLRYNPYHRKQMDSKVADIKNTDLSGIAGTLTAYAFLREFVDYPEAWTHVDIAGPGWTDKGLGATKYGATGYGVHLFYKLLKFMEDLTTNDDALF
jgi:leucyl aminopeptidase